jgi:hypothetical protein
VSRFKIDTALLQAGKVKGFGPHRRDTLPVSS